MIKYTKGIHNKSKFVILTTVSLLIATAVILYNVRNTEASPSQVVDGTSANASAFTAQRHVIRTTNGTNSNRTFVLVFNGANIVLYYSDDPEASSPTWSPLTVSSGTTYQIADMVWDESNNVIYVAYGRGAPANNNNSDIFYKRITALGTTPVVGTARTVLNGTSGGTTYNYPHIEIAGDSSTTKVLVFASQQTSGGNPTGWSVGAGTINSDNPTWTTYSAKTWTAAVAGGVIGVTRVNTDKLAVLYYNGTDVVATRHDDSSAVNATSGWDALDGTDNSQTTISSDDPASRGLGTTTSSLTSDNIWFGWLDSSNDINTRRWNGSSLDTEMTPVAFSGSAIGPSLVMDENNLYMVYQNNSDATQLVYQTRSATDGTTAWSGTKVTLDDITENVTYPGTAKRLYQGKLDIVYTTGTSFIVRHVSSYAVTGFAYQESGGSPYEGTTVWSGCDGTTANVAVSIAGGTKVNAVCNSSTGAFYFILPQPSSANVDITVFLDTAGGDKGAIFTHNNDTLTDITGLKLYKDRILIESQSSTSVTNSDINSYDQSNDADIPVASDGTTATFDTGTKVIINTGDTYAPGGAVTLPKLHIKGTYTGASETLTINGSGSSSSCDDTLTNLRPLCIDSGTFTPTSNTTLFTGSSASLIETTTYNTLRIEPAGNTITHTLRSGTLTINSDAVFGNGTNTSISIELNTNDPIVSISGNITINSNTTLQASGTNTLSVAGNWQNSGTFNSNNGTVSLTGSDSSTQSLTGNTTFYNLSTSTSTNSAGRTIQFAGSSTTTISGTWTVTGFSGKVITLQSSDSNNWIINPVTASVDYSTVSRSDSGIAICAIHSTNGGNNNANWDFSAGTSCNDVPNTPSLDTPADSATNQSTTPILSTTATDSDSDYLRYKIEICTDVGMTTSCQTFDQTSSQTGWSGQNTQTSTAYTSGTQAVYTIQTPLLNSTVYYWRSYTKDPAGTDTWSGTQTPYSFTTDALSGDNSFNFKGLNFKGINLQ